VRVTLANGDWVDLTDRLNYAQARRLNASRGTEDAAGTMVAALVTAWALRDIEDQPIDLPERADDGIPLGALDRVPYDTFITVAAAAMEILPGQPDPKDTGEQSPDSPPGSRNGSTQISQMPTSSPTFRDGPGGISELPRPT